MILKFPEQRPHYAIPPGYGYHRLSVDELKERTHLLDTLQIYEYPKKGHRYIIAADVSDGIGKDRSSIDVLRMGTIDRVEEQVAHYLTNTTTPSALAYIIQAVGNLYKWPDGREAMVCIENNNHGLATQNILQLHLGYQHFYIWEVLDEADPSKRFTTKLGWVTTSRTRPYLLSTFHDAVVAIDPLTGGSDLRINSSLTMEDMRDFQTDGALWEAEAARGAHDDCVISLALAHQIAFRLLGGETEPLADRRRRRAEEEVRRHRLGQAGRRDYRNSDSLAEETKYAGPLDEEQDDGNSELEFYDPDGRAFGGTLY